MASEGIVGIRAAYDKIGSAEKLHIMVVKLTSTDNTVACFLRSFIDLHQPPFIRTIEFSSLAININLLYIYGLSFDGEALEKT